MNSELLKKLQSVDTPTVCNAIEVAQGKRGFNKFTRGTVLCSNNLNINSSSKVSAGQNPISLVGYARTAQIAAIEPPQESAEIIRERRMAYYKYMSKAPKPALTVIEDLDYPHAIGAFWGEINTAVHKGLGIAGVLTNGVMRDLGDLPDSFPVIAGSIGPSHGFVHIKSVSEPVNVFGMEVKEGDLVHADRHGALVIPVDVIPLLADAIDSLLATEQLILKPAREEGFDFAAFEEAWESFEKART
jgi:regulator of RNase E activity RraA